MERNPVVIIRERVISVIKDWRLILRLSIAPAAAWWISLQFFDHSQAFFAPVAAILTLTVGAGERIPIVVEIVIGASLGILVGELLVSVIGSGTWQLFLVITLAVISARFVRLSGLALTQAVISSVLLVAVVPIPGTDDPALARFVDALLGGAVALATLVLIPSNPLKQVTAGLRELRTELAEVIEKTAEALRLGDAEMASAALEQARATQPMVTTMNTLGESVREMARISPFQWRQRQRLIKRTNTLVEFDHAIRNTRVLSRRVAAMLRHGEVAPPGLAQALSDLADLIRDDLENIDALVAIARLAITTASDNLTINTAAVASQIRAIVADLLLAAGTPFDDLDELLDFE